MLEPIPIKFKVSNQTNSSLKITKPSFESAIKIRTNFNGVTKDYWNLFNFSISQIKFPVTLAPGEKITEQGILRSQLGKIFPEPGIYDVQIILTVDKVEKTHNVKITINEPSEFNKEAFEFLRKYETETNGESLF